MLVCENCRSGQFLQITHSDVAFDGDGNPTLFDEEIACMVCQIEGEYHWRRSGDREYEWTERGVVSSYEQPNMGPATIASSVAKDGETA